MEATTGQVRKRSHGGVIVFAAVLLAIVLAAGYYQQEILTYYKLQGWDTAAVKQMLERFVRQSNEGDPAAAELLDPAWVKPDIKNGKLTGVIQSSGSTLGALGPYTTTTKTYAPAPTIKEFDVRIKHRSKVFQADVQYPNGQWAPFDVDRVNGALRIRQVPDQLSSSKPPKQPWD